MKLMFDLSPENQAVYEEAHARCPEERMMYCVPFNILGEDYIDGYMVFTDKNIYKIVDGKLIEEFSIVNAEIFKIEGSMGGFAMYAILDGKWHMICRFTGRHQSRFYVILRAMEILIEKKDNTPIENNTPERFCPKCGRPFIYASTICPSCIDKKEVYRKLWAMTRGLRLMMCVPMIVAAINVVFSFIVPKIQASAINNYINPAQGVERGPESGLMLIVAAMLSIELFRQFMGLVQARVSAISGTRFSQMIRTLMYEKVQSLSLASVSKRTAGDLINRINGDTGAVQSFIMSTLPSIFIQLASFIIAFIVLIVMEPLVCLFVFVPVPFAVFIIKSYWKKIRKLNIKNWRSVTRASYILHDILTGIRVVKTFGQEENEIVRYGEVAKAANRMSENISKYSITVFPFITAFMHLGLYLIYLYGYTGIVEGRFDLGTIHQFISYANLVYSPLLAITSIPSQITSFLTSASKVFEILEEQNEIADIDLPLDINIEGEIKLENVTFGYQSYDPVLEEVTATIKPGEFIGIVGHSGSGKTTLINLIMRLYDVNEGAIIIDDVNIKDISQNALRKQIGVVLQETILFEGTIRDNIRYANPFATDEEVIQAARIANAHDFIMNLPDGYNTKVGEKGLTLSGGERQRVSIARAIINDPKILILDEATAALDTETEKLIQDALNKVSHNRTTLAIAHRLSTLRNADRLLVLDHGRLAEFGTHAELLANKGIYYKLVMAQKKMAEATSKASEKAEKELAAQAAAAGAKKK